ncbi:MAG: JAB domain-containing protein [Bacteroidetes bacterium]|nr:JAB domain-containing protein [Bacteroidota bacterium]MBU1718734.1 JAB domain-containing protein [Bacteroidota bacterium]
MAVRKIDQKGYKYYVFNPKTKKIITGWEYRNDAYDFVKEADSNDLKVYTRTYLAYQLGIDPAHNKSWGAELGKPYPTTPEVVLFGDFRKDVQIPEIKIRYNKGKPYAKLTTSEDVYEFLLKVYGRSVDIQEQFVILLADIQLNIIGYYKHTIGTKNSVIVDVPMILGIVLKSLATSFIVSHNHPSGTTKPSESDIKLTRNLQKAAATMKLTMLDHIIITKNNGYYSFADEGVLEEISISGVKKSATTGSIEKRLRKEVFEQLQKVQKNRNLTPKVYEAIQSQKGYEYMERRIINMVITDGITISACIPQIESEL